MAETEPIRTDEAAILSTKMNNALRRRRRQKKANPKMSLQQSNDKRKA